MVDIILTLNRGESSIVGWPFFAVYCPVDLLHMNTHTPIPTRTHTRTQIPQVSDQEVPKEEQPERLYSSGS